MRRAATAAAVRRGRRWRRQRPGSLGPAADALSIGLVHDDFAPRGQEMNEVGVNGLSFGWTHTSRAASMPARAIMPGDEDVRRNGAAGARDRVRAHILHV